MASQPTARPERLLDLGLLSGLVALVGFVALRPIYNVDIWWHLVVGRWILSEGALPTADVFSAVDPGAPWRSFQWLFQVAAASIDQHAGLEFVRLLVVAVVAATYGAFAAWLRGQGLRRSLVALLTLALLVAFHDRIRVRPHALNPLAWLLLAGALTRLRAARPWHGLLSGAAFFVWGALHAGAAWIGCGALLLSVGGGLALGRRHGRLPADAGAMAVALGAVAGLALVPGSAATLSVLLSQHGESMGSIDEWLSWPGALATLWGPGAPERALDWLWRPLVLLVWPVSAGALIGHLRHLLSARAATERPDAGRPFEPLLFAVALILSFVWFRFTYMAVIGLAAALIWRRRWPAEPPSPPAQRSRSALCGALAALLVLANLGYATFGAWPDLDSALAARAQTVDTRRFPDALTRAMAAAEVDARVATVPAWGGYVLYHGWPRLRVTIDGRQVAPPEVQAIMSRARQIYRAREGAETLPALFAHLPADLLLMPRPAFPGLSNTEPWIPVAAGGPAELFVRRGPWVEQNGARLAEAVRGVFKRSN
jgi:hypothetical protein